MLYQWRHLAHLSSPSGSTVSVALEDFERVYMCICCISHYASIIRPETPIFSQPYLPLQSSNTGAYLFPSYQPDIYICVYIYMYIYVYVVYKHYANIKARKAI